MAKAPAKKEAATKKKASNKAADAKTRTVAKKTTAKLTSAKKFKAEKAASSKTAGNKKLISKGPDTENRAVTKKTVKKASSKTLGTKRIAKKASAKQISGYGVGSVDVVMSVDQVVKEAASISAKAPRSGELQKLAENKPFLSIEQLDAGYGKMEILHKFNLQVAKGQSLCLIGPNGAGKSTVLHSVFGFTNIFSGKISIDGKDVTNLTPSQKLSEAGIAYILQDKSVFPGMTVEENLLMGGFLKNKPAEAKIAAEMVFDKYSRLAERRDKPAGVLSGGERRLLEISRALVMNPEVLLVDEPSIGLEPRFIDMVFEILNDLQRRDGKTIVMVEQNAKKGLDFADIGYVLVSGETAIADTGNKLLANPDVGRLFLGG